MYSSPIPNGPVLESKHNLEQHLKYIESKIWSESENEQRIKERDLLEGDLGVFLHASELLVRSIEGDNLQRKEDALTAQGGIKSYLVHIRSECRTIDRELSQQNRLAEEKNCVINCLAICRQALGESNCLAEKDTAEIVTPSGHSLAFSTPDGGQQVIGTLPGVRTSLNAVAVGQNVVQILGSFTDEGLQDISAKMSRMKIGGDINGLGQKIPRTQNNVHSPREKKRDTKTGSNYSAGASYVCFENIHTKAGVFHIDVSTPAGRIKGEFSSAAELREFYARRNATEVVEGPCFSHA